MAIGQGGGARIQGLDEFRRGLRRLSVDLAKDLRKVHKKAADQMAEVANSAASGSASGTVKGRATQKAARVEFNPGRRGDALAKLWGADRKSGWYSRPQYRGSAGRQFQPYVGGAWQVGDSRGEPYEVGGAMNSAVDDLYELYGDEIETLAVKSRAFPIPL